MRAASLLLGLACRFGPAGPHARRGRHSSRPSLSVSPDKPLE